jgi:hypothetical protein
MNAREIASAMARLGAESLRDHVLGDARLTPRYGFAVVRRGGLWCFSSRTYEIELFNHVSGYGTFAPATQRSIDAMLRHYDALERRVRVEMLSPVVSRADRALLARNGFRDTHTLFQCHVRTSSRPPRARSVAGLEVARARPADASRYARLATKGFGGGGPISEVFERGWIRQIRKDRRVGAFIGSLNGRPAATGVIVMRPRIAGFYSGSVLRHYRGRGVQNAMIAARLAHGWARGVRTFYSWTDPESASAHNLRDEGFRTRFELHIWEREG